MSTKSFIVQAFDSISHTFLSTGLLPSSKSSSDNILKELAFSKHVLPKKAGLLPMGRKYQNKN